MSVREELGLCLGGEVIIMRQTARPQECIYRNQARPGWWLEPGRRKPDHLDLKSWLICKLPVCHPERRNGSRAGRESEREREREKEGERERGRERGG